MLPSSNLNLLKMRLHLDDERAFPFAFKICLATIGVAFLSATASAGVCVGVGLTKFLYYPNRIAFSASMRLTASERRR